LRSWAKIGQLNFKGDQAMQMKWLVSNGTEKYQFNLMQYSSLFVNHTTNESELLNPLIEYFQPRSKMKDIVTVKDLENGLDDITPHALTAFQVSNHMLAEETLLGSKSLLKSHLKHEFSNHLETDGYLLTINTLVEDLLDTVVDELPFKSKKFTMDSLIKLLEIDLSSIENDKTTNSLVSQNKLILQLIQKHLKVTHTNSLILFLMFPELSLSPRDQLAMKNFLLDLCNDIQVFVVTCSKRFIVDNLHGMNYFSYGKQVITDELLNDLEWESPLPYGREELIQSLLNVIKNHIDMFELVPLISNYVNAEIVVFNSIDLYVLIFMMNRLKFKYKLDLDVKNMDKPVYRYVMDIYEKI
jgi:hypothetical protein